MKNLLLLLPFIILMSCEPEPKFLTPDQEEAEKEMIIQVNRDYNKASQNKDFAAIVETLGDEVTFFGTDENEVIRSFADFKESIRKQWQEYDKMVYGDLQDIYVKLDNDASIASIIFGVPLTVTKNDVTNNYFLRVARTMEKKGDKWFIVSGIVGIARTAVEAKQDYQKEEADSTETE
jgi:ketosteroid isomerase-like protein